MSDGLIHPDWQRWLNALKDRAESIVAIGAEQVVTGSFDPSRIPPIPWDRVLKAGSSLGDLETRSAGDLSSGTLPDARMPALSGDVSSVAGAVETTLATVNLSPGTYGSGSTVPIINVNAKGLVTGVTDQPIVFGSGAYTIGDLLYADSPTSLARLADVAVGSALISGGVATAPAWSALPMLSGGLILGVQGTGGAALRVAHAEPAGGNPDAYYGVFPDTFTFTNNGTYYDNTGFYGWNGDLASATEPQFGLALESKFSQGSALPFYVELHHVATFSDATSVRVLSQTIDRAAPHLAASYFAGQIDFVTSSTAAAQVLNFRMTENGTTTFYNGPPITVVNYANGASSAGKGEFAFLSSDAFPQWVFKLSGTQKAALACDLANNALQFTPGANTGYFFLNGGRLAVYQSHATERALTVQASGGDLAFFSNDGSTALFRITTSARVGIKTASPLSMLHLPAGTATANTAPLQFTSGTVETTARAGVVEFLTDDYFATITTGAARKAFVLDDGARLTSGKIPVASTNGRLIDGPTLGAGGLKLVTVQAAGRATAQTAAVASVTTYTLSASDGDILIAANVNVTTSTLHSFAVQVDYTDETNTAQTLTLTFTQLSAASVSTITNATGAGPYSGVLVQLRCKASTAVTVKTTGTFTTVTYNVGASISQVA